MSKKIILKSLILILVLGFVACEKSVDSLPQPSPDNRSFVQFSANAVQLTNIQLYALISIKNSAGQEIVSNKKVTLDYIQGIYKTDKIQLTEGEHKLTKFIVLKASDTAIYAVPKTGSAKASLVTNPLDLSFTISNSGVTGTSVQVLKVTETDVPGSYGYSESDFGFVPFINVLVKLKINVGQVAYDNLSGKLLVNAINGQGGVWLREIDLQKGLNQVRIPENYTNYKFEVVKWNSSAVRNYVRSELQSSMVVSLETTRQAKKLTEESVFIENSAGLIPDSRSEYFYNIDNRLVGIKNYQKSIQVSGLPLTNIYKFKYNGALLDTIKRFAADNSSTGYTAFFYNSGYISNMFNRSYDQETGAAVEYNQVEEFRNIKADYLFNNGNSMTYTVKYFDGNKINDQAISSTGGGESGIYEYDENINPKHQLGYPDLYFTNTSKNNLKKEQKTYGGAIPQVVPYKFEYTYDTDGYPSEVFISYKGFTSQQHLYIIKKVYKYQ